MLGHQRGGELLARGWSTPTRHHALRNHSGQSHPLQVAQQPVLAEGDPLVGLLDGVGSGTEPDDPHDVPRQAARQRYDVLIGPLLQRRATTAV